MPARTTGKSGRAPGPAGANRKPSADSGSRVEAVCLVRALPAGRGSPQAGVRRDRDALPAPGELDALATPALRRLLLRLTGLNNTGRMSRELLLRAVAWHLQMKAALEGGRHGPDAALAEAARAVQRRNRALLRRIAQETARQRQADEAAADAAPAPAIASARAGAPSASGGNGSEEAGTYEHVALPGHPSAGPDGDGGGRPARRRRPPAPRAEPLPPGSRLIREWRGETHEVIVQSDGTLLWRGKAWKSLSVIARTITGAAWSGPRFFGTLEKGQGDA